MRHPTGRGYGSVQYRIEEDDGAVLEDAPRGECGVNMLAVLERKVVLIRQGSIVLRLLTSGCLRRIDQP
jgi:hypothetical protein